MAKQRPRTGYVMAKKSRRCAKCGSVLNNQLKRCKRCGKEAGFPKKSSRASK